MPNKSVMGVLITAIVTVVVVRWEKGRAYLLITDLPCIVWVRM
jgi:hypothetical protein